jgi:hypothetical protein
MQNKEISKSFLYLIILKETSKEILVPGFKTP